MDVDSAWDIQWYGIASLSDHARTLRERSPERPIVLSVKDGNGNSDHWQYSAEEARVVAEYLASASGSDIRLPGPAWRWRCPERIAVLMADSLLQSAEHEEANG